MLQPTKSTETAERLTSLLEQAANVIHTGHRPKSVVLGEDIFKNDDNIKQDIVRMILQYLEDEGYRQARVVLQDEANVKVVERQQRQALVRRMRKTILDGDWVEAEKLCSKQTFKNHRNFLYSLYVQQYLEQVENHEHQKALMLLSRKIKPLEQTAAEGEIHELCYLLTCSSLQESPAYKNWEGAGPAREKLVEKFENILELENLVPEIDIPPNRLLELLRQAVSYQIEFSRYHPKMVPKIETLLRDFSSFVIPNAPKAYLTGHRANVKCVEFVGSEGNYVVSGSSDNTLRVWDTATSQLERVLEGHTSRIWDLSSNSSGTFVASASADKTVKIWNLGGRYTEECTLSGHISDVYATRFHPGQNHVVTGGYDQTVRLYDVRTTTCLKVLSGHELAVSRVTFNPHGNLIISGSKDGTVRFWDIASGLCIKTISAQFEVTSVEVNEAGSYMLVACKNNSNRLWDLRMMRPIQRFRGHQNTSKNFIRSGFGPTRHLVTGGSEDGNIPIWDINTGNMLQILPGHRGTVYNAVWNPGQSLLA
eukprot:Ihof_evm2s489 gene=Ihof_evmTU2s489